MIEKIKGFVIVAAIAAVLVIAGSTAAWASETQSCPTSPNYAPDFSSNQNCLALNPVTGTTPVFVGTSPVVLQLTSSLADQTGSAWYSTPQIVENGFTTSFQFQFTNPSLPPADGIAFVIQGSSTAAIGYTGGNGGALGYGDDDGSTNPSTGEGIPNSLAIEFDTYENSWDPGPNGNGSVSHVAVQSCGTGPNTSHHNFYCMGGQSGSNSTLGPPVVTANMVDGAIHNVTIQYFAACSTCSPATPANVHVKLDGVDLYPNGVAVDLSSIGLGPGGTAYVGFTGATGGDWETQDILNWSFAPQQGQTISPSSGLTQSFVSNGAPGEHVEFDFNFSVANGNGNLNIAAGTTPFVGSAGITSLEWASIVNGTGLSSTSCLLAVGVTDANGNPLCALSTLTCTTSANSTPSGANCPQSSARNILYSQQNDLVQNQTGIVNGQLTIPPGYAFGMAELPDTITNQQCSYPSGSPLQGQLCPQSILSQLEDNTPHGGGTGGTGNSTYALFCCQPEWATTPTISLWNKSTSVPVSFTSVPPPVPIPNTNNFQAAQGAYVVVGAESPSLGPLDTTYPLPGEQSLANSTPCLASPTTWSEQHPQAFSVNGTITNYDNGTTAPAPLTEGSYLAHYFSVDCDAFEELIYPTSLNVAPGTPGPNVLLFKTVPFNVDLTKPNISSITLNPPGGIYAQNSTVTASFTCSDPISNGVASGIASCGPNSGYAGQNPVVVTGAAVPTNVVGSSLTYTATATDQARNSYSASVPYQVVGPDNVAVAMIGGLLVKTGTNLTYDIFVVNSGPNVADLVTVRDTLPAGTSFVSSGYAIDSCTFGSGPPQCSINAPKNSCGSVPGTCSIGSLPVWASKNAVGAVVQITVKVTASPNTILTNTAVVSGLNPNTDTKYLKATWPTLVTK